LATPRIFDIPFDFSPEFCGLLRCFIPVCVSCSPAFKRRESPNPLELAGPLRHRLEAVDLYDASSSRELFESSFRWCLRIWDAAAAALDAIFLTALCFVGGGAWMEREYCCVCWECGEGMRLGLATLCDTRTACLRLQEERINAFFAC
jgi:hypothetical protein